MNFLDAINCHARKCGWQIFTMNNTAGDAKDLLTKHGDLSKDAFDLKSDGLMNFLDAINCHAHKCGWQIFTMNNTAGNAKDLLTKHGDLSIDDVIAQATAVFSINPLTRNAQEDGQLFACINNSMTQGAIDVLNLCQDKFLLPAPIDECSGICFLRVNIAEAQVDTRATTNLLLGQLTSGLPDVMAKEGGNIRAFNQQVMSIVCRVKRRGADPGSILPQLLQFVSAHPGMTRMESLPGTSKI